MECEKTKELRIKIKEKLPNKNLFKYEHILAEPKIMDIVADFIINNNIEIYTLSTFTILLSRYLWIIKLNYIPVLLYILNICVILYRY